MVQNRTRSIRFVLLAWFAGLALVLLVPFGIYQAERAAVRSNAVALRDLSRSAAALAREVGSVIHFQVKAVELLAAELPEEAFRTPLARLELVRMADEAMYRAKHGGKNRVCVYSGGRPDGSPKGAVRGVAAKEEAAGVPGVRRGPTTRAAASRASPTGSRGSTTAV